MMVNEGNQNWKRAPSSEHDSLLRSGAAQEVTKAYTMIRHLQTLWRGCILLILMLSQNSRSACPHVCHPFPFTIIVQVHTSLSLSLNFRTSSVSLTAIGWGWLRQLSSIAGWLRQLHCLSRLTSSTWECRLAKHYPRIPTHEQSADFEYVCTFPMD